MADDGDRREDEGVRTAQAWILGLLAGLVILALIGVGYTIGFNQGEDEGGGTATEEAAGAGAGEETGAEAGGAEAGGAEAGGPGEELFVTDCGTCHTLEAAGTDGTIGPNLDDLAPDDAQVLSAIENGGAGSGAMPANIVSGEEAEQVAAYVAEASAGQ